MLHEETVSPTKVTSRIQKLHGRLVDRPVTAFHGCKPCVSLSTFGISSTSRYLKPLQSFQKS